MQNHQFALLCFILFRISKLFETSRSVDEVYVDVDVDVVYRIKEMEICHPIIHQSLIPCITPPPEYPQHHPSTLDLPPSVSSHH